MKKVLFAIAALLTVASTFSAQAASKGFSKKNIYLGGSAGFTSTSVKVPDGVGGTGSTDASSFKIIADLGYDLDKKNSIGLQVGYLSGLASMGSFDNVNISDLLWSVAGIAADQRKGNNNISGLRIAPFVRHTLVSNKTFDLFVDAVIGFETFKTKTSGDDGNGAIVDQGTKANLFELVIRPGFSFKITKDIKFVTRFGSAGYQSIKSKTFVGNQNNDGPEISRFGFSASSGSLLFGFEYHF